MTASRSLIALLTIVTFAAGPRAAFSSALAAACPPATRVTAGKTAPKQDKNTAERRTRVVPVKLAPASKVANVLKEVYLRTRISEQPQFVADDRTNSLIVTSTDDQFDVIQGLVKHLDSIDRRSDAAPAEDASFVRVRVAVYEVTMEREQLSSLSTNDLTAKAETPAALENALADYGKARLLYETTQIPDDRGRPDTISLGASAPYVSGTSVSKAGNTMSRIEYEQVGVAVTSSGSVKSKTTGTAQVDMEFSGVAESDIELGNDVRAPIKWKLKQVFSGPFVSGKPTVLLAVNAESDGRIVAYVTRLVFTIETP